MKKTVIILFVFAAIWAFLPIPLPGWSGVYNTWSGLIWSTSNPAIAEPARLHEEGHRLDDTMGWISKTINFQTIIANMGLDLWDNPKENYASIYELARGKQENMPIILQEYYGWKAQE